MTFPATRLAREAKQLITETEEPYLRNHSLRSFLFGRAAAGGSGQIAGEDYDAELVFLICALHDVGLTDQANTNQGARTLTDAVVGQALANPLEAPAITFPGEVLHQRRPELPYTTWDMLLDAGGWGD
jgi:hypothetical protein